MPSLECRVGLSVERLPLIVVHYMHKHALGTPLSQSGYYSTARLNAGLRVQASTNMYNAGGTRRATPAAPSKRLSATSPSTTHVTQARAVYWDPGINPPLRTIINSGRSLRKLPSRRHLPLSTTSGNAASRRRRRVATLAGDLVYTLSR